MGSRQSKMRKKVICRDQNCIYEFKNTDTSMCPKCGAKGPRYWYDGYKYSPYYKSS